MSTNWIEYFGQTTLLDNMAEVREEVRKHRNIGSGGGRFAVVNVGTAKGAVFERHDITLSFKDLQEREYPSHAGIYGYTTSAPTNLKIAHTLSELVRQKDMM